MDLLEKRITEQTHKVDELRMQLQREESFLLGLQEAFKLMPVTKDKKSQANTGKPILRTGSVKKAYELIKQTGKPMNITEILIGIGKEDTKQNRASLASSLYRSSKKGGFIVKVDANLFSIQDLQSKVKEKDLFTLPTNFGKDDKKEDEPEDIPF